MSTIKEELLAAIEVAPDEVLVQTRLSFPDRFVEAPLNLTESMTNAPSDRHVVATAIVSNASYIVTFNLKDFPKTSLANYEGAALFRR
jgi:predicted nucleic acid-binding protein